MEFRSAPSPNFDDRKLPVSMLVLHYTGMESGTAALERLCDPEAKVSAHYMVEDDGRVFRLVDEDKRAWHAGVAEWAGITDVNSASIGIEIVNGGHNVPNVDGSLPDYPDIQIEAVITLCQGILNRHDIIHIVGHSDVSPARKIDPGEHFPWQRLAENGIGFWPDNIEDDRRVLFEPGSRDRGVSVIQSGLAHIGYGARVTGRLDEDTSLIIAALQRRYRPDQIDGQVDVMTLEIVKALVSSVDCGIVHTH